MSRKNNPKEGSEAAKEYFDPEAKQMITAFEIYERVLRELGAADPMDRWLKTFEDLCPTLEEIDPSPKMKVFHYLAFKMRYGTNEFTCTRDDVVAATGVSMPTVNRFFEAALATDLFRHVKGSTYVFNPRKLYSGTQGMGIGISRRYSLLKAPKKKVVKEKDELSALEKKLNKSKIIANGGDME